MSKNQSKGVESLQLLLGQVAGDKKPLPEAVKAEVAKRNEAQRNRKPTAYIGKVEAHYLDVAFDKLTQALHPNFIAAASASTLKIAQRIQQTCKLVDAKKPASSKLACVMVGKALKDDSRAYVTFWQQLLSNVAFAAHMDLLRIEQSLNPEEVDDSLDAMGEDHAYEPGDQPAFDRAQAERHSLDVCDEVEHPFQITDDPEEIHEAVKNIQAWIETAFLSFTSQQLDYWQCVPVPLCKRGAEDDYAPITDLDDYRAFQREQWRAKQRSVPKSADVDLDMMAEEAA